MLLHKLIANSDTEQVLGNTEIEISGLAFDSRKIEPGFLYIALPGYQVDGHTFIPQAVAKGALAVVTNRVEEGLPVAQIIVRNPRKYMALIANRLHSNPSRSIHLTGLTGTNGKTTTAHIINSIYKAAGTPSALIGTIGKKTDDTYEAVNLTTPESVDLQRMLGSLVKEGIKQVSIEVSSHALAQNRVDYCSFDTAVFTNITHDHLDFHQTMEEYFMTKAKLFKMLDESEKPQKLAVINKDDPYFDKLNSLVQTEVISFGLDKPAQVTAKDIRLSKSNIGQVFTLQVPGQETRISLPLVGRFNILNTLAAVAASYGQGISLEDIKNGLESLPPIPGRLEIIYQPVPYQIYIDYAHTPDGLEQVLSTLSLQPHRRFILVFGCPGDRDRKKRPIMGRIAEKYCDLLILTADNPASEDTIDIIKDMKKGITGESTSIPDREEAVNYALAQAGDGDIVLIAGKGHENYQIVGQERIPYSDRLTVQKFFS